MTREDVLKVLSILKAAYPHSFRGMTRLDGEALVNLWAHQFAGEDAAEVEAAVDALISTRKEGFSPTVGEIKDSLLRIKGAGWLSEAEAWNLVERACRRGLYNSAEEFYRLPPDVQAAVGGHEQLKAWAAMDAEVVNSVIASNFRKSFASVTAQKRELDMMPPDVRAVVSGIADKMRIEKGERAEIAAKKPAALPVPLQPMTEVTLPRVEVTKGNPMTSEYKPPSAEEWENRRAALLETLEAEGGTA